MMHKKLVLVLLVAWISHDAAAQVRLPRLVRDSMVLQRDTRLNIWGWAGVGEKVTVTFKGKAYRARTGADGKWSVVLPPSKAGGPYTMDIKAGNTISLKEILVGDVWVCAGQSNMVHTMELHNITYAPDIANANYPHIRQFLVPVSANLLRPQDDLSSGYWKAATPDDVKKFSAVAYFFARTIYERYRVPIGLINTSVGGTPIEAWTSEEGLKDFPSLVNTIQQNKDTAYVNGINKNAAATNIRPKPNDLGLIQQWFDVTYVPRGWRTINIPGYWEDQGVKDLDGVVWYRKEIGIPAFMTEKTARVFLGRIVDADILYINGRQVGATTYQYPQRRYDVPPGLLKAGKNILVIRVTNNSGKGGFVPDKPYCLFAGNDTIDLNGYWQYKVGEVFAPRKWASEISVQNQPASLYNAMVAPFTHYAVKGVLWYQGESNARNPGMYQGLLQALISDWRAQWKQPGLPFLYAQLPGFMDMNYLPAESDWALLREAQFKALSIDNTAMAVTIDLGEWNDIHPDNKKDVGLRLARAAKKLVYKENIVHSGPLFRSSTIVRNKIILTFDHIGSGLTTMDGEEPAEFAIAGADKKFAWARTKIEGNTVVVWLDDMKEPKYVRYAWADNPVNPNLYNKEGLPASPFRTDP